MESSQINIHARAEQNLKPAAALFTADKCKDGVPSPDRPSPVQSSEGSAASSSVTREYYLVPAQCWSPAVSYVHRENATPLPNGRVTQNAPSLKRSESPVSPKSMPPPKKKWMKNFLGKLLDNRDVFLGFRKKFHCVTCWIFLYDPYNKLFLLRIAKLFIYICSAIFTNIHVYLIYLLCILHCNETTICTQIIRR